MCDHRAFPKLLFLGHIPQLALDLTQSLLTWHTSGLIVLVECLGSSRSTIPISSVCTRIISFFNTCVILQVLVVHFAQLIFNQWDGVIPRSYCSLTSTNKSQVLLTTSNIWRTLQKWLHYIELRKPTKTVYSALWQCILPSALHSDQMVPKEWISVNTDQTLNSKYTVVIKHANDRTYI